MLIVAALGSGLDMWKRLFPNLARIDSGKLFGWCFTAILAWIAIYGVTLDFFISQGWVTVVWPER